MRGRSPIVNIMAEEDSQQLFRFDSTVFDYYSVYYFMILFSKIRICVQFVANHMRETKPLIKVLC